MNDREFDALERRLARYWALYFTVGAALAVLAAALHQPWLELPAGMGMANGIAGLLVARKFRRQDEKEKDGN